MKSGGVTNEAINENGVSTARRMNAALVRSFKHLLSLVGARLPARSLHRFQLALNYMKLGRWMSEHNFRFDRRVRDRNGVFASVAERVRDRRVLYLEFGVFQGASMKYWSRELRHPESTLHGFDSFEGLPEDFDVAAGYAKGSLSTQGALPFIDDARVRFFKGWFDQTLPTYSLPGHDVLIITMDADLYSSTIYVLRHLRPWIQRGTFIYFDNMSRPEHEPRAFDEFIRESGLKFDPVCADRSLNTAFFECKG